MKIYQIISEQRNTTESKILKDLKKLSPKEQKVFQELITTRPEDIKVGTKKQDKSGDTYRWEGAQWVNTKSGRIADRKTRLDLSTKGEVTPDVQRLYQTAKDQKLIKPIRKELEKSSATSRSSKKKQDKDDDKGYQGTGLVSAMTKATGYSAPSKEPGADPEIYKSREKKKDDEINQRLKDLIAKQNK